MKFLVIFSALFISSASTFAMEVFPIFPTNACILFQGDSITDGGRWREGHDFNHIMGQDYAYLIAAKIGAEFPERRLNFVNRGISGNKISDLAARWQTDTLALKPDVLSILIGINDAGSAIANLTNGVTVMQYEQTYEQLITNTFAVLPRVQIILCEPFVLPVGRVKADWEKWNSEIKLRRQIVEKLAAKYHLPLVRFQKTFTDACQRAPADYWSWDGIHPTYAGHQLMADEWLRTAAKSAKWDLPF